MFGSNIDQQLGVGSTVPMVPKPTKCAEFLGEEKIKKIVCISNSSLLLTGFNYLHE
jgi:hypothetical protein